MDIKMRKSLWAQIGFLFLDESLGEYDVAMNVGHIVFLGRESEYFEHANPISELSAHFDEKIGRKDQYKQRTPIHYPLGVEI